MESTKSSGERQPSRRSFVLFKRLFFFFVFFSLPVLAHAFERVQIFLRPAEKTIIEFDRQIETVEAVSGANLLFRTINYPSRSVLKITASEVFSSANFHVIFKGGFVKTFTAYADPTAPLNYSFRVGGLESSSRKTESARTVYYFSRKVPKVVEPLLIGLNSLEKAKPVRFQYEVPLPPMVTAVVTRVLRLRGQRLFLELEVENSSSRPKILAASMFDDPLVEAVTIPGMDSEGRITLPPRSRVFVYLVRYED